jgi:NAD(P)-dependent dehydrogenase (short-subunit alcohol dehydrogenase family)
MERLRERVALVTGAAQGIGYGIAERLAAEGAHVIVNDVNADACEAAARRLGGTSAPGDVRTAAAEIVAAAGDRLDILVNNAGLTRDAPIHRMSDDDWRLVHDVALFGAFALCRAAFPLLKAQRGKVVNMSSAVGLYGAPGTANYAAAKAGLVGLTKSLAREWARHGITVNAVAPGLIEGTGLTAAKPRELIAAVAAKVPLGRAGTPADVAAAVAFLASPDADYMTGQVLEIHGGMEVLG